MKKIFSFMLILCMLIAVSVTGVNAAEPNLLWDFGSEEIEANMSDANTMSYFPEGDYHLFIATGNDPYVRMNTPVDDVSKVQWVKARVKNTGPATAIELFAQTNGRGLSGPECTHIDIEQKDEWLTYIVYIPDANIETANTWKGATLEAWYWEGTVDFIRLDAMWQEGDDGSDSGGNMASGDEIMIDYIAFFSTEEDAKAFRPELDPGYVEDVEIVDETPAEVTTEAPAAAIEAPVTTAPVTTAPQTSDYTVIAVAMMLMAAAVAFVIAKKRKAE